jgi:hypothetical protein
MTHTLDATHTSRTGMVELETIMSGNIEVVLDVRPNRR